MICHMRSIYLLIGLRHSGELLMRQVEWIDRRATRRLIVAAKAGGRRQKERDIVGAIHTQACVGHACAPAFGDRSEASRKAHAIALMALVIDDWLRNLIVARRH